MTTQRALSRRSCGISSGMFRISSMTVPAFSMRSTSFSLSAAGGRAKAAGATKSRPAARYFESCIISSLRSVFGTYMQDPIGLFAVASNDEYSPGQSDDPEDRGQRNGLVLLFGGLDGSNVHNFLVGCISNALIYKSDNPECDQGQTEQRCALHCVVSVSYKLIICLRCWTDRSQGRRAT